MASSNETHQATAATRSKSKGGAKTEMAPAPPIAEALFMKGTWVGSFASFVHDLPVDIFDPYTPRFSVYRYFVKKAVPTTISAYDAETKASEYVKRHDDAETSGYAPAANIMCLRFLDEFKLMGKVKINRGGKNIKESGDVGFDTAGNRIFVNGGYDCNWNATLCTFEGEFSTEFDTPAGIVYTRYYYIASGWDEIEMLWLSSALDDRPFRANVARATLKRVPEPFRR
jgi:hypothetical protein